jgi:hypothetical protein
MAASFVMVISNVTGKQLENIIGIQVKSENKITFVPQGLQGQPNNPSVYSPTMAKGALAHGNSSTSEVVYNFVRLEWGENAAHFAKEVFDLFIHEEKKEEKAA